MSEKVEVEIVIHGHQHGGSLVKKGESVYVSPVIATWMEDNGVGLVKQSRTETKPSKTSRTTNSK
ncbi:MAG: hypothetical protein GQ570_03875 [Helicobacteraceae bacterium]|nr:hypothetical protein [Helicobacteraceae bacterium]